MRTNPLQGVESLITSRALPHALAPRAENQRCNNAHKARNFSIFTAAGRRRARLVCGTAAKCKCPAHARAQQTGPHCENTLANEGKLLKKIGAGIIRMCSGRDVRRSDNVKDITFFGDVSSVSDVT